MASRFQHKEVVFLKMFLRCYHGRLPPSKTSIPRTLQGHRDDQVTEVIDVRTPDEFKEDHIPGAINLPVLSNEDRITVGTLYSKDKFAARKLGASIICSNISHHLQNYFYSKSQNYSPLVYCWRGGQRSYSLAIVLTQVGFPTSVLDGGYKGYRSKVREDLKTVPNKFQYKVISGINMVVLIHRKVAIPIVQDLE